MFMDDSVRLEEEEGMQEAVVEVLPAAAADMPGKRFANTLVAYMIFLVFVDFA
jgi:hypothetical protein